MSQQDQKIPAEPATHQENSQRGSMALLWEILGCGLLLTPFAFQILCLLSAMFGGRENRIHLMGVFAAMPFSLLGSGGMIAILMYRPALTTSGYRILILTCMIFLGQAVFFIFG